METLNTQSSSYAGVAKRNFPSLVLDFTSNGSNVNLTTTIIADFLFDELKLIKDEVTKVSKVPSPPSNLNGFKKTVRVRTADEIIVRNRFGESCEFQRSYGNIIWTCQIRGGRKNSNLRLLNVPDDINEDRMIETITTFAKPLSTVRDEVFGHLHDQRLAGIPNGNKLILIEVVERVPDFIEVGTRKIRVLHRSQPSRCFACQETGHLQAECPSRMNSVVDTDHNNDASHNAPGEPIMNKPNQFPSPAPTEPPKKKNPKERSKDDEIEHPQGFLNEEKKRKLRKRNDTQIRSTTSTRSGTSVTRTEEKNSSELTNDHAVRITDLNDPHTGVRDSDESA